MERVHVLADVGTAVEDVIAVDLEDWNDDLFAQRLGELADHIWATVVERICPHPDYGFEFDVVLTESQFDGGGFENRLKVGGFGSSLPESFVEYVEDVVNRAIVEAFETFIPEA